MPFFQLLTVCREEVTKVRDDTLRHATDRINHEIQLRTAAEQECDKFTSQIQSLLQKNTAYERRAVAASKERHLLVKFCRMALEIIESEYRGTDKLQEPWIQQFKRLVYKLEGNEERKEQAKSKSR